MASPTATDRIRSRFFLALYDHDPGAATAIIVSPDGGTTKRTMDMRDYDEVAVVAMSSTRAGNGITKLEIVASDSADMSTNVTVIKDSGTVAADAVGDYVVEECTAAEVAQEGSDAGADLRYVAGRLTCENAADEAVVLYFGCPKRPRLDLTADTIA
jgi:hypothetical protein